jgi:hypothetical protein
MAVAGSITVTTSEAGSGLTKYSVAWLSNASGAVTENSFNVRAGELVQVEYVPDAGGTQPTDAYDMTLLNANSLDVLGGGGANLSNATRTQAVPAVSTYFRRTLEAGALTPTISNAGNAKGGTLILLVR